MLFFQEMKPHKFDQILCHLGFFPSSKYWGKWEVKLREGRYYVYKDIHFNLSAIAKVGKNSMPNRVK